LHLTGNDIFAAGRGEIHITNMFYTK
jgi:hypothetical protein